MYSKIIFFCFLLLFFNTMVFSQTREEYLARIRKTEMMSESLVEQQLTGYNNRNIEEFLKPFSDSVKVFNFRKGIDFEGKDQMRVIYKKLFDDYPDLHCKIVRRIVHGSTVIDQELVTVVKGYEDKAVAIYVVENEKIQEVHFVGSE